MEESVKARIKEELEVGYDAKTHPGLISEFGLRMIKTSLIDKKFGHYLRKVLK